jgi:hypothetical protein
VRSGECAIRSSDPSPTLTRCAYHGADCSDWSQRRAVMHGAAIFGTTRGQAIRVILGPWPSWSPDDSQIGFCAAVGIKPGGGRAHDLFRAYSDGTGATNVTLGLRQTSYVDWNEN